MRWRFIMDNDTRKRTVHTCYGCPWYYTNKNEIGFFRYPVKHCGQDHFKCPYYWGTGEPLGPVNDGNIHYPFYEYLNNYNQRF